MIRSWPVSAGLFVLTAALSPSTPARADQASPDGLWNALDQMPASHALGQAWIRPLQFQAAELDFNGMVNHLRQAPLEDTPAARANPLVVFLPRPDGQFERFAVSESPIMEPGLATQFPEIRTYLGQGIDHRAATLRCDTTPAGFHAQVLSPEGNYYIDPYTRDNVVAYASYHKKDLINPHGFTCEAIGAVEPPDDGGFGVRSSGGTRRQYRLACAATGEYTAFFGGTVTQGQAAIVTAINRVTGIYELEFAVRMVLVTNNSSLVYTNATTDPYTNSNGSTMLTQNINNCNTVIGSANYDIGHVFSTGGGGVAFLGVVCTSNKAGGVTGLPSPTGDAFYVDYVAHEMGHQFGANHCFNGTASNCGGGNRSGASAYEPGSASTIMGYAGICGVDDLQTNSDAYFVHRSYDEIMAFVTTGSGNNCDAPTTTGNNPPTISAGANFTIPKQTPFQLTAAGSDLDGDALTYCWEQRDLGAAQSASAGVFADNGDSPFIRSFNPTTSPTRMIPRLSNLLANTFVIGEQLPNLTTQVHFRCTARDNRAGTGGVNTSDMIVTVSTTSGPFTVTAPNTNVSWSGNQTVTWNVANTSVTPVNCANVRILLSTNGGNTWLTELLASTPNTGSAVVTLPSISTTTARIRVEAVGNFFFDISNTNFTITPGAAPPATPTNVEATPSTVCTGRPVNLTATVGAGETVYWYTGGCGTTQVGTGSPLVVNPTSTTTYFARARRNSDSVFSTTCASATVAVNPLLGDLDLDSLIDGGDVQGFVTCLMGTGGTNCTCADFNASASVTSADVPPFVSAVLGP